MRRPSDFWVSLDEFCSDLRSAYTQWEVWLWSFKVCAYDVYQKKGGKNKKRGGETLRHAMAALAALHGVYLVEFCSDLRAFSRKLQDWLWSWRLAMNECYQNDDGVWEKMLKKSTVRLSTGTNRQVTIHEWRETQMCRAHYGQLFDVWNVPIDHILREIHAMKICL